MPTYTTNQFREKLRRQFAEECDTMDELLNHMEYPIVADEDDRERLVMDIICAHDQIWNVVDRANAEIMNAQEQGGCDVSYTAAVELNQDVDDYLERISVAEKDLQQSVFLGRNFQLTSDNIGRDMHNPGTYKIEYLDDADRLVRVEANEGVASGYGDFTINGKSASYYADPVDQRENNIDKDIAEREALLDSLKSMRDEMDSEENELDDDYLDDAFLDL